MTQPIRVLVVDDNRSAADALARVLKRGGDHVEAVYDGATAIQRIEADPPDFVFTDLRMEPVDGIEVLRAARRARPPAEVVVFTAYGAVDTAVEAMRLGARDFLTKPVSAQQLFARLDEFRVTHYQAEAVERAVVKIEEEPPAIVELPLPEGMPYLTDSPASKALGEVLESAARVSSPVWLEGDVGAGKSDAAETIHRLGPVPEAPYQVIDAARPFTLPHVGTAYLPNLDTLPLEAQRDLQRRLTQASPALRLLASSSPDAPRLVAEGSLLPELYYQLAVMVIRVPNLRDRPDDVVPLFVGALEHFALRYKRKCPSLTDAEKAHLASHRWPGNLRELRNLAERTMVMGKSALHFEAQPDTGDGLPVLEPGFSLSSYLESVEKRLLEEALRQTGGDRTQAGKLLGVERNSLRYKLNKYGLLD